MRINDYWEIAKEVERLVVEKGLGYKEALRIAKERYLGDNNGKVDKITHRDVR